MAAENSGVASCRNGTGRPVSDATSMRSSISSVGRPCIGRRTVMSYSSPSPSRNLPALVPATAARTVRSMSTGATPSNAAFCGSTRRSRSVRSRCTGLSTSRVPGVASMICSARAASVRSSSRSGPEIATSIGALIGGPFTYDSTMMRAPGYSANAARSSSYSRGLRCGSKSCSSANTSATLALVSSG